MDTLVKILVRVGTFALALTLFMQLVLPRMSEPGDANIGAGLLAFLVLALAGFCWGLFDGRRMGVTSAVVCWGVVSGLFALGWLVADVLSDADSARDAMDLVASDATLIPFNFLLVFVPAVIGAAIGSATRSAQAS